MKSKDHALGEVLDFYDHIRVPLSSMEREHRQGPYRYYGAQNVIDHIDAYLFDGEYVLIAEDGANLVSRQDPIAFLVDGQFWVNNHAHIVRGKDKIADNYFIVAWLNNANIAGFVTGVAQPKLSQQNLKQVKIRLPPIEEQRRITGVLSAYTDLIENNRRRMALLEQAARQLYQEWFVRLRFPGYEHTRITDGVPEGWMRTDLQLACVPEIGIQTGPFGSQLHQSDYSVEGIPVVMPKDIVGSLITTDSIARVPDEIRQRLSRHILQAGDIVLARRGDIGRKAFVTAREAGWMCGTGCMRLRPNPEVVAPRLLYDTIGRGDVMGIVVGRAQGAIMPNLNMSILTDLPLELPSLRLQTEYVEFIAPVHRQIQVLAEQNEKLRAARDLLLPRLMSGEVAV